MTWSCIKKILRNSLKKTISANKWISKVAGYNINIQKSLIFLYTNMDSKDIKPVNPKGNQPWIFIGRTDAEASVLWPPGVKSWHFGKDPDAGQVWGQEEKGVTEDEMVGWHHWLNGHEFVQTQGDSEGQRHLACCSSRGCKESDMT